MTFTYLGTGATTLDELRIALGDRTSSAPLFTDEELNHFLTEEASDVSKALLRALDAAANEHARAYDFETDGQSYKRSQMAKAFADRAAALRAQGVSTSADTSAVSTVAVTKVDGYSQTVTNEDVTAVDDDDDFDTV